MSEQIQTHLQVIDVISDQDNSQWIMLLNHRDGLVELLPVMHTPGTDKKLVLWNKRQVLRFDYGHETYLKPGTVGMSPGVAT